MSYVCNSYFSVLTAARLQVTCLEQPGAVHREARHSPSADALPKGLGLHDALASDLELTREGASFCCRTAATRVHVFGARKGKRSEATETESVQSALHSLAEEECCYGHAFAAQLAEEWNAPSQRAFLCKVGQTARNFAPLAG